MISFYALVDLQSEIRVFGRDYMYQAGKEIKLHLDLVFGERFMACLGNDSAISIWFLNMAGCFSKYFVVYFLYTMINQNKD